MHLGQRIMNMPRHTIMNFVISSIGICILSIGCTNTDMEKSNNHFMGFEEEQYFLQNWIDKNIATPVLIDPMWDYGAYYEVIEEEILSILDDFEFYVLYIERNIDGGVWNVFLIGHNRTEWVQFCWENEQKVALGKPLLRDNWDKRICNFRFSGDIVVDTGKNIVLDATSVYLFMTCHDGVKRFVVYHPNFSRIDRKSDNRYILKIRKIVKNLKRDYQRIQKTQKRET